MGCGVLLMGERPSPAGPVSQFAPLHPTPHIVWRALDGDETSRVFEVLGLPDSVLATLRQAGLSPEQWTRIFAVYAGVSSGDMPIDRPATLGHFEIVEGRIRFQPRFPIERDVPYLAVLDVRRLSAPTLPVLPDPALPSREGEDRVVADFILPSEAQPGTTCLTHIYPSADVLPENLLKLYLHFSAPMRRGESYRHIRLVQEGGQLVDLPFLELDEELWDREQRRLTLLLDPGRIKEGLKPREESGAIFEPGRRYTLFIDGTWRDAEGKPLQAPVQKSFLVVARDDQSPDPRKWKIEAAPSGTRDPLVVTFAEPLDQALVSRLLWVHDAEDRPLEGSASLTDMERRWEFVPASPWRKGNYRLKADPVLEDLAGNSIGRPFEVDMRKEASKSVPPSTILFGVE